VLVATDAAARGLDLPGVRHVVQADFAPSAIDFLHRASARCLDWGVLTGGC
jgi:superfamily II DNA/RNA helicase